LGIVTAENLRKAHEKLESVNTIGKEKRELIYKSRRKKRLRKDIGYDFIPLPYRT